MEIVKSFTENDTTRNITIRGNEENPLFRAADIADVLELNNIRQIITNFDDSEKVLIPIETRGGIQNTLFLTENGLYEVFYKSKSPIAKTFRKWVANVIKEIRLTGEYKLKNELDSVKSELKEVKAKIVKNDKLKFKKEETVYIREDFDTNNILSDGSFAKVYKVGKTEDMNIRNDQYATSNFKETLMFTIPCNNCRILETVSHHMLRKFKDINKPEWFHTTFEVVKNAVLTAQKVIDCAIAPDMDDTRIIQKLQEIQTIIPDIKPEESTKHPEIVEKYMKQEQEKITEPEKEPDTKICTLDLIKEFINDCCILDDDEKLNEKAINLNACLRLWLKRSATRTELQVLSSYLKETFLKTRVFNSSNNADQLAYKGIKLKTFVYWKPSEPSIFFDDFIAEECILEYGARVVVSDIEEEYENWRNQKGMEKIKPRIRNKELHDYLKQFFVKVNGSMSVRNQIQNQSGYFGLTLKKDPVIENSYGTSSSDKRTRAILQINPTTKEIVREFSTMAEMKAIIKCDPHHVLRRTKDGIYKGMMYKYKDN